MSDPRAAKTSPPAQIEPLAL